MSVEKITVVAASEQHASELISRLQKEDAALWSLWMLLERDSDSGIEDIAPKITTFINRSIVCDDPMVKNALLLKMRELVYRLAKSSTTHGEQ